MSETGQAKIKAVLFDWDGVLHDSLDASWRVYNEILAKLSRPLLSREEFLRLQSPNWYEFYRALNIAEGLWKQVDRDWLTLYSKQKTKLHRDARPCLVGLKKMGLKTAIVTNGSRGRVREELERFRVLSKVDVFVSARRRTELKPSPILLLRALSRLRLEPRDAVFVGDSPVDIVAARNAKIPAVAITRASPATERLSSEKPAFIFTDLTEMMGEMFAAAPLG